MPNEFQKITRTDEIFFKYAKGMRDVVGKEVHTYNEILFFISGDVEFISEKGRETLSPNTAVIIPKEMFHQFIVIGDNSDYIRCVFNFESVSELENLIFSKINKIMLLQSEKINELFETLMNIDSMNLTKTEADILLKSLFAQILVSIKTEGSVFLNQASFFNPKVEAALSYINKNLQNPITVPDIAKALNISDSHLAHIFKKDMHISVHKYILEKRLVLARNKIRSSTPPERAAIESGFNDYSGFFVQFKKMFGVSPSKIK